MVIDSADPKREGIYFKLDSSYFYQRKFPPAGMGTDCGPAFWG
jgi:hypothetical protein